MKASAKKATNRLTPPASRPVTVPLATSACSLGRRNTLLVAPISTASTPTSWRRTRSSMRVNTPRLAELTMSSMPAFFTSDATSTCPMTLSRSTCPMMPLMSTRLMMPSMSTRSMIFWMSTWSMIFWMSIRSSSASMSSRASTASRST